MTGQTPAAVFLSAYDEQLRGRIECDGATSVASRGPLWWATFGEHGMVGYRDLGGLTGDALGDAIDATAAHFRQQRCVRQVEWKTRGHDHAPGLIDALTARGFVAEPEETVMVGAVELVLTAPPVPEGVVVRSVGDGHDLREDVQRCEDLAVAVFGTPSMSRVDDLVAQLNDPDAGVRLVLAERDGVVLSRGRVNRDAGTDFAGLWGGCTLDTWRGKGLYRAVVALRARLAQAMGARFVYSDCTPMSRPILERSGLVPITTTTPYVWQIPRS